MKLATFDGGFGRIEDDVLIPMGSDLVTFLVSGEAEDSTPIALDNLDLLAPIPRPGKILAIGPNYLEHASEAQQNVPASADDLIVMAKFANSVIGPGAAIELPAATSQVDYEAELAVVIGRRARELDEGEALEYVAGYVCVNDVTDRNQQFRLGGLRGLNRSKAIDTFLPMGPWIVTPDEVGDPEDLRIRCILNDEVVQDASSGHMLFNVAEILASLSKTITLEPGDLVATGSPPGVGYGRDPQLFLREGDTVTVDIDGIGPLTNGVVQRPARR